MEDNKLLTAGGLQGVLSARGALLGWLWFGCSTILPSHPAASAKFPSAQAESGRQWNTPNSSHAYQSTSIWNALHKAIAMFPQVIIPVYKQSGPSSRRQPFVDIEMRVVLLYSLGLQVVKKVLQHVFWKFHRQLGWTAAAMLPKQARGTVRKNFTKPFTQPAAQGLGRYFQYFQKVS